ncbi:hypothetical protein SK128_022787 [Halocaridina rubra]|uniref:VWFC domain-containing protein n=1 Tax=Halocaridina rubra TaxID=373956 RepID=A0AAN8WGB6_HALRR
MAGIGIGEIDCSNVKCRGPPSEDCVLMEPEFGCCGDWVCDNKPRNCTGRDGTQHPLYSSWNDDNCTYCYCSFSSFNGARAYCYPKTYCRPVPHRDCINIGLPEGSCCEEYSCEK